MARYTRFTACTVLYLLFMLNFLVSISLIEFLLLVLHLLSGIG